MKRHEFDHAVRAAGAVLDASEVLVIGSQAVHGSLSEPLPAEADRSVEVDIVPPDDNDGAKADLLDATIGEASMFHATFGFYAQGVAESTARLPERWRERLVRYESPATNGVVAWCLELHDLWISKAVAGRAKDAEFCTALLSGGHVGPAVLTERLDAVNRIDDATRDRVQAWIDRGRGRRSRQG